MGEKIGAGGKPQAYDEQTGQYGSGTFTGESAPGKKNGKVIAPVGEKRGCVYVGKDGSRQFVSDGEKPKGRIADASVEKCASGGKAPKLSKQEYATLRAEVIRKNTAQKGKVKPINHAFTAGYFYVYSTEGDDAFTVMKQFDIETQGALIDEYLRGKK